MKYSLNTARRLFLFYFPDSLMNIININIHVINSYT